MDIEFINYKGINFLVLLKSSTCLVLLDKKCKFQKLHYHFYCSSEVYLTFEIFSTETKQEKHAECNEEQWDARVQILNKIVCKQASYYYFFIAINSNNSKLIF